MVRNMKTRCAVFRPRNGLGWRKERHIGREEFDARGRSFRTGFRCVHVEKPSSYRVIRGGSWGNDAAFCRAAYRSNDDPGFRGFILGFRCLRREE
jgi:formylglycine-generating enzyme required for sulfatase activity